MSYLALARKWRPRTFAQLVGQEHINKALINSLNQQRLHHAYLFTGTRGVGKTSIARLLAKALNCEQGVSSEPCLECDACLAIEQGRFIDLIEIDGASKTRVEDTRDLLENVQYAPTNGRFKIYLIDEVHMLSQHSFNALLKTLEEPPTHVKFLLATTDPQKLPVTVLSRCLQFSLKHLPANLISKHLQQIMNAEELTFETAALDLLAKAARGSMRDALSLLDQAIASSDNCLLVNEVKGILGYTQQDYAIQLLQALANNEALQMIGLSRQVAIEGGHFRYVLDELLDYLHQISVHQHTPQDNPFINTNAAVKVLAQKINAEDIQLFYQIGIKGLEEMHLAPTLAIAFEMILLRMLTFRPASIAVTPSLAYEAVKTTQPGTPNTEVASITIKSTEPSAPKLQITEPPIKQVEQVTVETTLDAAPIVENLGSIAKDTDWGTIVSKLKLSGLTLNAAENAELLGKSGREITLRVARGHQSLFTPSVTTRIEQALETYYGSAIKIILNTGEPVQSSPAQQKQQAQNQKQQNAEVTLQNDPFFQQLRQEFAAELVKNSIVPIENDL